MKTSQYSQFLLSLSFIFLLTFLTAIPSMAQSSPPEVQAFNIKIQKKKGEIKMKCQEGCKWKKLSFSTEQRYQHFISDSGLRKQKGTENEPAAFLFDIQSTSEGVSLRGLEGTAWTELSFGMKKNGKQKLNQFGMTD